MLNKNILYLFLAALLSSCSCNKKTSPPIKPEPEIIIPELPADLDDQIIDPFINHDIDYSKPPKNFSPQISPPKKRACTQTVLSQNKTKLSKHKKGSTKKTNLAQLKSTPTGLKYAILHHGPTKQALPEVGQTLVTHYNLWLNQADEPGELIDSSYSRGLPFEFKIGVGQVIRAWDEGLMFMRPGDKYRFYVPSELAWGQAGAAKFVPSNTDLIYEIELIAIK